VEFYQVFDRQKRETGETFCPNHQTREIGTSYRKTLKITSVCSGQSKMKDRDIPKNSRMEYEQLKLSNQVCFPIYAASRLITRAYQPLLEKLDLTYPQYLVLMVLWEKDRVSVNEITDKLILNTNTVTPLLKRMEIQGLITRQRSDLDERRVTVSLTEKGWALRVQAANIPYLLTEKLDKGALKINELIALRDQLNRLVEAIKD